MQTYSYTFEQSSNPNGYNSYWQTKTTETRAMAASSSPTPNYAGQTMLSVLQSGSQQWCTFYKYDNNGFAILEAEPSAVIGYSEQYADLLNFVNCTYAAPH